MSNDIDDIKPDEICEMTTALDRAFRAAHCVPECHCCEKRIEIGQQFKLGYVKRPKSAWDHSRDEMLCADCTPAKLLRSERIARKRVLTGGFSRIHR